MKNILILISILLITATACNDDFIDLKPEDKISDDNYWTSASDIELYANQFYPQLFPNSNTFFRNDDYSDNQAYKNRTAYIWDESVVPTTGGGWGKSDWLQIRRVNYALARLTDLTKTDEVKRYEGEIRFFKSFFYFQKVKRFGDVPWLEKDLNIDSDELFASRDSRVDVVANILKDLDFAIENLPETDGAGRITKYAALTLKTEVCLYEGTFRKYHNLGSYEELLRKAASSAEEIMNSGLFSLYSTGNPEQDYFDLFVQYDLTGNPEAILFKHFIKDKFMHNNTRYMGEPATGFTKDFVESYLCKDGLPISLSPLYQGDAEYEDEFIDRDPRMKQSIHTSERQYGIYADGSFEYKICPQFEVNRCPTGYEIIKYYSPLEADRQQNQSVIDQHIFRYGKVLLDYAEAKAELGECTQDVLDQSVNLLRDRVGMPHLTVDVGFTDPNWPDWEVAVNPLINEIRRERRIELSAESYRWDDLVRWKAGKLIENPKTFVGARDPETDDYRVLYPGFTERNWDDKLYLYPIPIQ
ncbi:MAG: RagB/SusD family nutrient uptake outer membrane protein, partial [Bacteroidales bacterium]|nr:RagB/SusD family nutrient uptake outer membrane protein [Bacteroidales bacterium]